MESSVDFLRRIFDLLNDGGVFDVHNDEPKAIVDFKHPEEMKVTEAKRGNFLVNH